MFYRWLRVAFNMQKELHRNKSKGAHHNRKGENTIEVIIRSPSSQLEEVVFECPDLTQNQVFCELSRLSRGGYVRLTMKGSGLHAMPNLPSCNHPA